jgi:AhpC/TSA family protein
MKQRSLLMIAAICLLAAAALAPLAGADDKKPMPSPMRLNVGDMAPDFKLQYFDGSNLKDVSLSQYRGKSNVVVAFYIFAFTGG